ncbi:MAG TPA: hypothetical protein H9772_00630 [Candidatus Oscillibacter pullicola]|nr:hypothetical protein [Candidatus Oscillibacter pullicola]
MRRYGDIRPARRELVEKVERLRGSGRHSALLPALQRACGNSRFPRIDS